VEKKQLQELTELNLSTREIANRLKCSQTNVRYYLKKYKLQTTPIKQHKCGKCGETDPSKFYGHKKEICGKCHNHYTTQQGMDKKKRAVEYKGGKCSSCGYSKCVEALDFHHVSDKDPNWKSARGWSWDRLEKELDKCVLLCANCHREEHAKQNAGIP